MHKLTLSLLSAALLSPAVLAQQTLVVPNGYATTEGNSNNIYPWGRGTSSMRVQNIYDSTAFTGQSVTGTVVITRLRFRADAIATSWAGGTYPQVQIDMSTCPVDYLAVSGTFASNHGANLTTVHNGPVTVIGGTGSSPGPWYIDIPLSNPFLYDPSAGDLTLDIQLNGAGWSGGTAAFDNVDVAGVPGPLGSRVFDSASGTPNGPTGTVGPNYVAVCEFTYSLGAGYASTTSFGTGCYDAAMSFYEMFGNNTFDLGGIAPGSNSILLQFTGTGYAVLPGSNAWFTPVSANLGLIDDSVSAAQALPFPLITPAGMVNSVWISSNGFLWTAANTNNGCCDGDASQLLSMAERFAPLWMDLNPSSGGSVHFDVDPVTSAAYVTWNGVPEYGQSSPNFFQVAILPSMGVEFRYQACANVAHTVLTGWSPGNGARNPGSRDLSASLPFVTQADNVPLALSASARPVLGTSINLVSSNIPSGTPLGIQVLGLQQFNPGINLGIIGMPDCFQYASLDAKLLFLPTGSSHAVPVVIPNLAGLAGVSIKAQSLTLSSGFNPLGALSSNGVVLGLDRR